VPVLPLLLFISYWRAAFAHHFFAMAFAGRLSFVGRLSKLEVLLLFIFALFC